MIWLLFACTPSPVTDTGPCPPWYADVDGDGFGVESDAVDSCEPLDGRSQLAGDCDDRDPAAYPGAVDPTGDGVDADCDGLDGCEGAVSVSGTDPLSCDGQFLAVTGDLSALPDGDCVCSVSGDLQVPASARTLVLRRLEEVGGNLEADTVDLELALLGLAQVGGSVEIRDGGGSVRLPALVSAQRVAIEHVDALDLSALQQTLSVSLDGSTLTELDLRGLSELEALTLEHNPVLTRVLLAPEAHVGTLELTNNGALDTHPFPGGVRMDWLDWRAGGEVCELDISGLSTLVLGGWGSLTLRGLERYDSPLRVDGALELTLPGTHTLAGIDLRYGSLHAPALRSTEGVRLDNASLWAPLLTRSTDSVEADKGSTLSVPSLTETATLSVSGEADLDSLQSAETVWARGVDLPALVQAESVDSDAQLPALTQVGFLAGSPSAPLLTQVDDGVLEVRDGDLPQLRVAQDGLTLEGHAVLPALRTSGPLVLDDVSVFDVPESAAVERIELQGQTATPLPDPLPWPLWTSQYAPDSPLSLSEVDGGVFIRDTQSSQGTDIQLGTVHGNLTLYAPSWVHLGSFSLQRVEGDLTHCLSAVPPSEKAAWLDAIEVTGQVEEDCS